jgi:hypothetical protein
MHGHGRAALHDLHRNRITEFIHILRRFGERVTDGRVVGRNDQRIACEFRDDALAGRRGDDGFLGRQQRHGESHAGRGGEDEFEFFHGFIS